jgi:CRISPR-associated protein Cas1
VHLRTAQHTAASDPQRSLEIARAVVAAKVRNSRHVIRRWARDANEAAQRSLLTARSDVLTDRLERLATVNDPNHLRGIEGDAARAHFAALGIVMADTQFPFPLRTRRPPRDPVNALLGFCYGLLTTEYVGAVQAVGLDHQIGFLHRVRSGRPSLALDLIEELRPLTDRFVVTLLRRNQIGRDAFTTTPGNAVYLAETGRRRLLTAWEEHKIQMLPHLLLERKVERWALPTIQATLLARHLRGDLPAYAAYVTGD